MSDEGPQDPPKPEAEIIDFEEAKRKKGVEDAKGDADKLARHLRAFFSGHRDATLTTSGNLMEQLWTPLIAYAEKEKAKLNPFTFDKTELATAQRNHETLPLNMVIENVRRHMEGEVHYSDVELYVLTDRLITEIKK